MKSPNQLIEPFFFEDDTVNGENYLSMLQQLFIPEIRKLYKVQSIIFEQDGIHRHFSIDIRHYLSTSVFLTDGLEEVVLFDGLHLHHT